MKKLPPDHPFFKQGWIVGQTFSGNSPMEEQEKLNAQSESSSNPSPKTHQYSEKEIADHLAKMKEQGYGTVELSMAEDLMRGLEGKPKGNG